MYQQASSSKQPFNLSLLNTAFWYSALPFGVLSWNSTFSDFFLNQINSQKINSLPPTINLSSLQNEQPMFNRMIHCSSSNQQSQQEYIVSKNRKKKRKNQTPNRNLNSNILKYFVKYLNDDKNKWFIEEKLKFVFLSYNKFFECLQKRVPKNSSYIRPIMIRQICLGIGVSRQFSKCFIALFRIFINTEFPIIINHLCKITKERKMKYISARRKLFHKILRPIIQQKPINQ